ncbi:MAG: hypothetical protein NC223_01980 [Butyrivibrio sp.]|nr:hypothetical protein [Butyrivibrio sp.]
MKNKLIMSMSIALSLVTLFSSSTSASETVRMENAEEVSDVNSVIEEAVSQAVSSQAKVFTDTVSQEQYENMNLTWEYSGAEFSDLLTDIDASDFHVHYEYDDNYRRISKNVDGEITYFIWSESGELLSEVKSDYTVNYIYIQGVLIGFEYDSEEYDYVFDDDFTIIGLKHNDSVICEYKYIDDVLCSVYRFDENGRKFLNTNPLYAGNVNGYKYKSNYVDSETGWIYNGRYVDWKNGRYVDGLACADMQRYIAEAGDVTLEIMYRINDIGIGGRKSEPSDDNECASASAAYGTAASVVPYVEQLDKISRTIWFESPKDALDQIGVAQVIQNRMAKDSKTAFEVISGGEFSAYERVLAGELPDTTSSVWSQALENARRLINKTSLVYHSYWFDDVYHFMGLNNAVTGQFPKFKYMNGTKWHARVATTSGYTYVPIKDVYTVVSENGVSYANGYITSIEVLASLSARYGGLFKYNVFYKLA